MQYLGKLSDFVSKYMAPLVIIVAAIALFEPSGFTWAAPKITVLLGIVMFGMGMTLKLRDFKLVFRRPRDVFIGALAQFTIMPLLAWCLAKAFGLPPELAAGVILVGTCPGGTSSNVRTYLARGDVALSVSVTMTTTLLAPIVTPLLTWWLAGAWVDISLTAMMLSILQVVILPIVLGILLNSLFEAQIQADAKQSHHAPAVGTKTVASHSCADTSPSMGVAALAHPCASKAVKILPLVSVLAIVLIAGGVVSVSSQRIMETGLLIMLVVMCHNLLGYGIGFLLAKACRMNMAKVKAISIEVGMQNSGLATSLAMLHFGAAAAIPGAIFSVWHNISGSLVANYLSGKINRERTSSLSRESSAENE